MYKKKKKGRKGEKRKETKPVTYTEEKLIGLTLYMATQMLQDNAALRQDQVSVISVEAPCIVPSRIGLSFPRSLPDCHGGLVLSSSALLSSQAPNQDVSLGKDVFLWQGVVLRF